MAVELLASRWLAPLFGFTLSTWAILIAVTLLAGSVGYWVGGLLSARVASWRIVGSCFLGTTVWLLAWCFGFPFVGRVLFRLPIHLGITVAALLLIGPSVMLMSMVLPVLVQLCRERLAVGLAVGRVYATSAIGSLIGTLGTGLWLVPFAGLRMSTLLLGVLLACFGTVIVVRSRVTKALAVTMAVLGGAQASWWLHEVLHVGQRICKDTMYGTVELASSPFQVALWVNGILQTGYSPLWLRKGALVSSRNYFELLPYLHPEGRRVLHVGLGAGLIPRCLLLHGLAVESVEVNPVLVALVRRSLHFEGPVFIGDGRRLIRTLKTRYDFIILDAFHGESLASHLMTREAFEDVSNRLSPGGIVSIHLIAPPQHLVTASAIRTLRAVFPHILCVQSGVANELQDLYVFASNRRLTVPDHPELRNYGWLGNEVFDCEWKTGTLLTDDRNPLDVLHAPLALALRQARSR